MRFTRSLAALAVTSVFASSAWATNGYAPHGIGQKAKGMAGVGIALPQDSLIGGMNPAGMVLVGNRLDVGVEWFRPIRDAEITGNLDPRNNTSYDGSDKKNFFIPSFGYNHMMSDKWSLGVSVFGSGGMNTSYAAPGIGFFNGHNGNKTGIDLIQLFVVPTISYKINDQHSIGVGLNLAGQWFRAQGLDGFKGASSSPTNLTDNGHDSSYGAGLRIGWIGKLTDRFTLGATYQTKTWMSEFDDYEGLFAEQGDFDIPENYGIGLAFQATPKLVLGFDVMRINYNGVKSIANNGPSTNPTWFPLGADNAAGFGWDDQTVYKLGVAYEYSPAWTFRAGWNHADSPIGKDQTLFNILAPATVEDHLTLGATWTLKNKQEITFHYMHAFENKIKGSNSIPPGMPPAGFGGGEANIEMHQDSFGVSWGMPL